MQELHDEKLMRVGVGDVSQYSLLQIRFLRYQKLVDSFEIINTKFV